MAAGPAETLSGDDSSELALHAVPRSSLPLYSVVRNDTL
jgi:hypothetical protein